jgi:integrase/recombinase XerD
MTQIRLDDIFSNRVDYLTKDQINTLLKIAYTANFRDFLLIRLLWVTGMRISECLAVTSRAINFDERSIKIKNLKHQGNRIVFFDEITKGYLENYIVISNIKPFDPLFSFKRAQARRIIKRYGKIIGLDLHPHTLRHSFATFLYQNGASLDSVKLILGHDSYHRNQAVYIHTTTISTKSEYDKVRFD